MNELKKINKELLELEEHFTMLEEKQKALAEKREQLEFVRRATRGKHILENLEIFLPLIEHTGADCSDDNTDDGGDYPCPRCLLISARRSGYWDDDYDIEISVVKRKK